MRTLLNVDPFETKTPTATNCLNTGEPGDDGDDDHDVDNVEIVFFLCW